MTTEEGRLELLVRQLGHLDLFDFDGLNGVWWMIDIILY